MATEPAEHQEPVDEEGSDSPLPSSDNLDQEEKIVILHRSEEPAEPMPGKAAKKAEARKRRREAKKKRELDKKTEEDKTKREFLKKMSRAPSPPHPDAAELMEMG